MCLSVSQRERSKQTGHPFPKSESRDGTSASHAVAGAQVPGSDSSVPGRSSAPFCVHTTAPILYCSPRRTCLPTAAEIVVRSNQNMWPSGAEKPIKPNPTAGIS